MERATTTGTAQTKQHAPERRLARAHPRHHGVVAAERRQRARRGIPGKEGPEPEAVQVAPRDGQPAIGQEACDPRRGGQDRREAKPAEVGQGRGRQQDVAQ